jgi:hypothetical protein
MLLKILALSSSDAVLSAMASSSLSTSLRTGLNALVVDLQDVLEHEHETADLLDQIGIVRFQAFHDRLLGGTVGEVQDFRNRRHAAGLFHALHEHVRESHLKPTLDLFDDVGVGLLHIRYTLDHLDLLLHREADEDLRGLVVRQVAEDQGDRLRVLILDEREQVLALCALEKAERLLLDLRLDLLEDPLGHLGVEGVLEDRLGVVEVALAQVLGCESEVVELCNNPAAQFRRDPPQAGELACHRLHHFGRHLLEDRRGIFLTKCEEEDRRLADAVEVGGVVGEFLVGLAGHGAMARPRSNGSGACWRRRGSA